MKKALLKVLATSVLTLCAKSAVAADSAPGIMRAGAAQGNITPALGASMYSGFLPYPARHVHDDLWVRCLVLDDGQTRLALVVCDVLDIMWHVSEAARQRIEQQTGLPAGNVLVSATHTHTAHDVVGDRFVVTPELNGVQEALVSRIVDTVRCAINNLEPARIGWGVTTEPRHVFNRRWHMKPGTIAPNPFGGTNDLVKMNPGVLNPNRVKPAGPVDPEIGFFAVQSTAGRPIALFANYALHYVGGNPASDISADYYGFFNERIRQLLGADRHDLRYPRFVSIMSNGASGDINNIDTESPRQKLPHYTQMQTVAEDVAQRVFAAYQTLSWHDRVPLGVSFCKIDLPFRRPTPDQLAWARKTLADLPPGESPKTWSGLYAERLVRMDAMPVSWGFPIQAFRIGDLGIATFPNDTFCEIGLEIKRRSPFKPTLVVSHAHGYFGYLPTVEQHALGGYETWIGSSRLEDDAAPKMIERLLGMLKKLNSE
jgi:neutral ceramidase